MVVLVTGGSGFIGTNFIIKLLAETTHTIVNYDALTYAANLDITSEIRDKSRYKFIHGNILDQSLFSEIIQIYRPTVIFHMAAESHVDRSITNSENFIQTNITGTVNVLDSTLSYWKTLPAEDASSFRLIHISTDEVYGDLGISDGLFSETSCYNPSSPYSASKASSDLLVRAWHRTYGLPTIITNCSNNYGPHQHSEKLIPTIIGSALSDGTIPIYGDGSNQRDWLYVEDHVSALIAIMNEGQIGESYLVGGNVVKANIELARLICSRLDLLVPGFRSSKIDGYSKLIKFVEDRPGHDWRYAVDSSKISKELRWSPKHDFNEGIDKTIRWYVGRFSNQKI